MACKDCLQNCKEIVSDQCVQYTGPEIPLLGICPGDQLSTVEAAIIEKILTFIDGTGVTPADIDIDCDFLNDIIGVLPKNLNNLLQMLVTANCTLRELITEIEEQISNNPTFNPGCLTGLPASPTRDDILQATVLLVCSLKVTVDAFPTTYVNLSDLTTLVTQIFNDINTGGGDTQYNRFLVPYVAYEYYGPLSNFDGSGAGISALNFDKVYICNGNNGTPDKRGRVAVGAISGVPGGTLDPAVDPAVNPNNPNWSLNQKAGETFHTLTVAEMPSHSHGVTDPGHFHSISSNIQYNGANSGGEGGSDEKSNFPPPPVTSTNVTGISIQTTGGGQPHNTIQPSIAAYYIMYVP
jgi:microcystin-dependent protein